MLMFRPARRIGGQEQGKNQLKKKTIQNQSNN